MRRAFLVGIAFAAATAPAATGGTIAPAALYSALLKKPFPRAELPAGFSSVTIGKMAPSINGERYHVLGEVQVSVAGPDALDAIGFYVFPSAADARDDFQHPDRNGAKLVGKVRGLTLPSSEVIASLHATNTAGQSLTVGETAMTVVSGNVIITSATVSAASKTRGSEPHALALLRAALAHLNAVRGG